jgi:Porin PorA
MKQALSLVLVGLGVFLLVLAPIVRFWVAPHIIRAPLDINAEIDAGGDGFNYLDATVGKNVTIPVSVTRHIIGDVSAGNKNVAVYDESLCLTRDDDHKGLGCQRAGSPLLLTNSSDRVAFDRVSGQPVAGNVCGAKENQDCKANVNGDTTIKHTGLGYKFPIDTKKQTYQFFDTVVGKSFPAVYKGTEKRGGLDCYKFVQEIKDQPAYTNGVLPSTYTNTRTVWVEPTTGVIVDGSENLNQVLTGRASLDPSSELRDPALAGLTALQGLLSFTDPTIKSQAKLATDNLPKIHAVRLYLPIGALVLGLISLIAGLVLSRRTDLAPPEQAGRSQADLVTH